MCCGCMLILRMGASVETGDWAEKRRAWMRCGGTRRDAKGSRASATPDPPPLRFSVRPCGFGHAVWKHAASVASLSRYPNRLAKMAKCIMRSCDLLSTRLRMPLTMLCRCHWRCCLHRFAYARCEETIPPCYPLSSRRCIRAPSPFAHPLSSLRMSPPCSSPRQLDPSKPVRLLLPTTSLHPHNTQSSTHTPARLSRTGE